MSAEKTPFQRFLESWHDPQASLGETADLVPPSSTICNLPDIEKNTIQLFSEIYKREVHREASTPSKEKATCFLSNGKKMRYRPR